MYKAILASLLATISLSTAVDIEGLISEGCHGERLYGYSVEHFDNCVDVSKYVPAASIAVNNFNDGQRVRFFSDAECKNKIYTADAPICYTDPDNNVNSFIVVQSISG